MRVTVIGSESNVVGVPWSKPCGVSVRPAGSVPLETIHALVCHRWIARGLRQTEAPPFSKDLERGIGMDDMVRVLAIPLLGLGLPLIVWLSVAKPL